MINKIESVIVDTLCGLVILLLSAMFLGLIGVIGYFGFLYPKIATIVIIVMFISYWIGRKIK
jgi:hypothetical protein